jgi:hypothetical protein
VEIGSNGDNLINNTAKAARSPNTGGRAVFSLSKNFTEVFKMSKTHVFDKWDGYYMEDMACEFCLYRKKKSKHCKNGCELSECCCEAEKREALKEGRIKRKKGWRKWD